MTPIPVVRDGQMTIGQLLAAIVEANLSMNTLVCIQKFPKRPIPHHIDFVAEDPSNTGVLTIHVGGLLQDDEVGYRI